MKRILALGFTFVSLLSACVSLTPTAYPPVTVAPQTNRARLQSFSTSDWFARLSPSLQQYYAPARGKTGLELFKTLNQIISKNQRVLSYGEAKSHMYAVVDHIPAPQRLTGLTGLLDHYSYVFIPGQGGNGNAYTEAQDDNQDGTLRDFINCEHTWPQSFFNKAQPMVSDLHHLFPTLSKPNAMRGNYPFGLSTGRHVVYSTVGGSKLAVLDKTGTLSPAEITRIMNLPYEQQPHDLIRTHFDIVFEPLNRQKGNTARAMLYFFLRYYQQPIRAGGFDEKNFWDSKVPLFLEWSERIDPVDEQEKRRHELVFQKQGNRNPFIDIPNVGSLIGAEVFQNL